MVNFPFGYCGGFAEARVNFKYPGSDWDTILSQNPPVLYQTEIIQNQQSPTQGMGQDCIPLTGLGQCRVAYEVKVRITGGNINSINTTNCAQGLFGPIGGLVVDYPSENFVRMGIAANNQNGVPTTFYRFASGFRGSNPYSFCITSIRRCDNGPDDCGSAEPQCRFTVTDETGIIFTRTEPECPDVAIDCGKKCPPNTCECIKGNMMCCYNSDGYLVTSFRR